MFFELVVHVLVELGTHPNLLLFLVLRSQLIFKGFLHKFLVFHEYDRRYFFV